MDKYAQKAYEQYVDGCNELLRMWCNKHQYGYEKDAWVAGRPGGTALIGDYYVDMDTILIDLAEDAPEEEFLKWYDYCLEVTPLDLNVMNFRSWIHGAPRIPEEKIKELYELRNELAELTKEIKQTYRDNIDDNKIRITY